jgi:uncharacterized membrane protein YhhN
MLDIAIIAAAAILLVLLLYCEKEEKPTVRLVTKTFLSLLFVFVAVVQDHSHLRYYRLLLAGLVFCLGGDVFLALRGKNTFLLGLIAFLVGHICYTVNFLYLADLGLWTWVGSVITIIISGCVYVWLRPHLGDMKIAVLCYVVVITLMVSSACSVLENTALGHAARMTIFLGSVCFYFSDLFVARDRFFKEEFLNRLVGLPMYYTGQFLLAYSVGLVR